MERALDAMVRRMEETLEREKPDLVVAQNLYRAAWRACFRLFRLPLRLA